MTENRSRIKMAYVPTRRETDVYPPPEPAYESRDRVWARLKDIFANIHDLEIVGIEWLNQEGILWDPRDVKKVADYMKEQKVDCLFMPHVNFGCEEVCGMLGKALGVPFLLWGPRDDVPPEDLTVDRPLDIQCGLFATSMVLRRYQVPFTYIENCWLDSPILEEEIQNFVRVASVVKAFRGMRIGQISTRPRPFLSVKVNESELLERFGIEIVPINGSEIVNTIHEVLANRAGDVAKQMDVIYEQVDCSAVSETYVRNTAALVLTFEYLAERYGCTAFASECWEVIPQNFDIWPCYAFGQLADLGIPVACETDIHNAISSVLAQAAARWETPVFTSDLTIRNPYNDNSELLWHCGPFPRSLAKEGTHPCMVGKCVGQYEIKGGDLTMVRLGASNGKYTLLAEEVKGCDGPVTNGNYIWVETENWVELEKKFIYGPYIHHVAGIHGKWKNVLREALKYIDGIDLDE